MKAKPSYDSLKKLSVVLTVNEALFLIEFLDATSPTFYESFTFKIEEANDMYFSGKRFLNYILEILPRDDIKFLKEVISNRDTEEIAINAHMEHHELAAFSKFLRKCTIVDYEKILIDPKKSKLVNSAAWKIREMLNWYGTNIDTQSAR